MSKAFNNKLKSIKEINIEMWDQYCSDVVAKYSIHDAMEEFFPELAERRQGDYYPAEFGGYESHTGMGFKVSKGGETACSFSHGQRGFSLFTFLDDVVFGGCGINRVRQFLYLRTGVDSWDYDLPRICKGYLKDRVIKGGYAIDGSDSHFKKRTNIRKAGKKNINMRGDDCGSAFQRKLRPYEDLSETRKIVTHGDGSLREMSADFPDLVENDIDSSIAVAKVHLSRLWEPDDMIWVGSQFSWTDMDGNIRSAYKSGLEKSDGRYPCPIATRQEHFDRWDGGIWLNDELTNMSRFKNNLARKKEYELDTPYITFESDDIPVEEQERFWVGVIKHVPYLQPRVIVTSGGKSLHGIIDARAFGEDWKTAQRVAQSIIWGLGGDFAIVNKIRIGRLAGCWRENRDSYQQLLYVSPKEESERDWDAVRERTANMSMMFDGIYESTKKKTKEV